MFHRSGRNHLSQRKVDAEFKKITASIDDTEFPESIPGNRPRFFGQNFSGTPQPLRFEAGPRDYQLGTDQVSQHFQAPKVGKISFSSRTRVFLVSLAIFLIIWALCFYFTFPMGIKYALFGGSLLLVLGSGLYCLKSPKDYRPHAED